MTFVAEELTQDLANQYTRNLHSRVYVIQDTYAIDRERGIVMLNFGGRGDMPKASGEGPSYYALFWGGQEISVQAWYGLGDCEEMRVMEYDVDWMSIPAGLDIPIGAIEQALKDALQAYWEALYEEPVGIRATFNGVERR